jgi:3'-5' exoribonuclease
MPQPQLPHMSGVQITTFSRMRPGQSGDCFALLVEKHRGTTRDGKPFYRVTFRDESRPVVAMVWQDSGWFEECEARWQPGAYYKVRCRYEETGYGPQIDIDRIREVTADDSADGFDPQLFHPATRFDRDAMQRELRGLAEAHITDPALKRLVLEILAEHAEAIRTLPASRRQHHAYTGGFLEHTLSVTRSALSLAERYAEHYPDMRPPLSLSLVVAGSILHDIGKLRELDYRPQGSEYTAAGRLVGHVAMGRDLVREKAAAIPDFDAEVLLRLEHVILSHQELPEPGASVHPATPEALLVRIANEADVQFDMMAAALSAPQGEAQAEFTERHDALRRPIFRGLAGAE